MTVYFISGLGADERIFQFIRLPDGVAAVHLQWIAPLRAETLPAYARRLAGGINKTKPFGIVGMSFGGMLATEMRRFLCPRFTLLLSTVAAPQELPTLFRLAGLLRLYHFISPALLKTITPFTYWLFSASSPEERRLLKTIIRDTDPVFLRWAVRAILTWKAGAPPEGLTRMHGEKDRLLPLKSNPARHIVKGAGHLAVLQQPGAVSHLLQQLIEISDLRSEI